jgi:hypothetical protein
MSHPRFNQTAVLLCLFFAVTCSIAGDSQTDLAARVKQLINQLDADDFETRQNATTALAGLGEKALPLLRDSINGASSAEVKSRLADVLKLIERNASSAAELHVIGVYEGEYPPGVQHAAGFHPQGKAAVKVFASSTPVILVVTAYEPVRWKIEVEEGGTIAQLVLAGYHDQEVEGLPASVPVIKRKFFTYDPGDDEFPQIREELLALTGKPIASFQGVYSYRGKAFLVKPGTTPKREVLRSAKIFAVGLYEGSYPMGAGHRGGVHPQGMAEVKVSATKDPIVLVLMAYEPINWKITCDADARIAMIIAGGYYKQAVEGEAKTVPVIVRAHGSYKVSEEGFDEMNRAVKELTGSPIAAFQGRYGYNGVPFIVPAPNDQAGNR